MISKKKIVFILPSLKAGGAERVTSFLVQNIDADKFDVSLVVIGFKEDSSFRFKKNTNIIFLQKERVRQAFFAIISYLNKQKPDLVLSSIGHTNNMMAIIALFFPKIKFVARLTNMHIPSPKSSLFSNIFYNTVLKIQHKKLDKIICQSNDMKDIAIEHYDYPLEKIVVINNPISEQFKVKTTKPKKDIPQLITVGRLVKIKGHERILKALSDLQITFKYTIIGDGPELENIFKKAEMLKLIQDIIHIPYTDEVEKYLNNSSIFLQGSYSEGFPNALLESCAVGTPVIAFTAPGGTKEIVVPGVNGYIADSEKEFIEYIHEICENGISEPQIIRNSVIDKFGPNIILKKYEQLFSDVLISQN